MYYKLFNPQLSVTVTVEKLEFLLFLKSYYVNWCEQESQEAYQLARISPFFKNTFIFRTIKKSSRI